MRYMYFQAGASSRQEINIIDTLYGKHMCECKTFNEAKIIIGALNELYGYKKVDKELL